MESPVKKLVFPALFALLALTGCAGTPAAGKPSAPLPVLNDAHRTALLAGFSKVDPELGSPRSVAGARSTCKSILAGASDAEQAHVVRLAFRNGGSKTLTDEQTASVLSVIKNNGFCTRM